MRLRRYRHKAANLQDAILAADKANIAIVKQEEDALLLMAISSPAKDAYIAFYAQARPQEAVSLSAIAATQPLHLDASSFLLWTNRQDRAKRAAERTGGTLLYSQSEHLAFRFKNLQQVNAFIGAFLEESDHDNVLLSC